MLRRLLWHVEFGGLSPNLNWAMMILVALQMVILHTQTGVHNVVLAPVPSEV